MADIECPSTNHESGFVSCLGGIGNRNDGEEETSVALVSFF